MNDLLNEVESVPRKTMTLFFMIDTSGSMAGNKIGAVNDAIVNVLPMLNDISDSNADAEIKVAALEFSSGCQWLYSEPKLANEFIWQDVTASGLTSLGCACSELASKLSRNGYMKSASGSYAPAIILLSVYCLKISTISLPGPFNHFPFLAVFSPYLTEKYCDKPLK